MDIRIPTTKRSIFTLWELDDSFAVMPRSLCMIQQSEQERILDTLNLPVSNIGILVKEIEHEMEHEMRIALQKEILTQLPERNLAIRSQMILYMNRYPIRLISHADGNTYGLGKITFYTSFDISINDNGDRYS